jgi:probable O-glycosylation ligase (exosortase A-associated)
MNIPVLIYLHKTEELPWMKWIVKAMLLCSYPAILLTYSRGAWLGMVIVTAASLLKSRRKFIALTVGGILVVLLQAIVPKIAPDRLMTRYDNLVNYEQDTSAESRFWNWEFCRRVGVARPLTGGGFTFYKPAVYRKYYPEFVARWGSEKTWSCHSTWLTIFGEHGFPGSIVWLSLFTCCLFDLRRIRSFSRTAAENERYGQYAEMVQSSFLAYLVVGTFLDAAYFDFAFYLVAVIVIVKRIVLERIQEKTSVPAYAGAYVTGPLRQV